MSLNKPSAGQKLPAGNTHTPESNEVVHSLWEGGAPRRVCGEGRDRLVTLKDRTRRSRLGLQAAFSKC
jgi:hypothetical protein